LYTATFPLKRDNKREGRRNLRRKRYREGPSLLKFPELTIAAKLGRSRGEIARGEKKSQTRWRQYWVGFRGGKNEEVSLEGGRQKTQGQKRDRS